VEGLQQIFNIINILEQKCTFLIKPST